MGKGPICAMNRERLYLDIINHLRDGVYYVDSNRKILFWNHAAEEITGYRADEMVGRHCQNSGLNHIDLAGRPLCQMNCPVYDTLTDGKARQDQVFVRHRDGYRIPVRISVFPVRENGRITGAIEIFTRNSPTVLEDDLVGRLSDIAMHDPLTGLPNRRYMESFLSYHMDEYRRFGREFCVLYADVDDFSRVNNTYGHDVGDEVLKNIARSLQQDVRRSDLVARWGGEEFVGVYAISTPSECGIIAERFRSLVEHTELVRGDDVVRATISVGMTAIRPDDTVQSLVDRADQAMYRSKQAGKNRVTTDLLP